MEVTKQEMVNKLRDKLSKTDDLELKKVLESKLKALTDNKIVQK